MRTINYPRITAIDSAITITADDQNLINGNASHEYTFSITKEDGSRETVGYLTFQNGPIAEVGINGVGQEAVLAMLIDRLQCFQSSKFSCKENAVALTHLEEATNMLNSRTLKRQMVNVEGTHETRPEEGRPHMATQ